GIRDLIVTGVQTCALPIYLDVEAGRWSGELELMVFSNPRQPVRGLRVANPIGVASIAIPHAVAIAVASNTRPADRVLAGVFEVRSEERRVGKEGRWGWAGG